MRAPNLTVNPQPSTLNIFMTDPKTDTFLAGRLLNVQLLCGTTAEVKVRQLPLAEYERAFTLLDDEIALTALFCGQDKKWAETLTPESYEALHAAAGEVNRKGFFSWCARQVARASERRAEAAGIEAGIQATLGSLSPTSPPRLPRTPA